MADGRPMSDDDLATLLREAEAREQAWSALAEADPEDDEPAGDACPHCGEPALALDECLVCGEAGCLPRDDWEPGMADPCLTRCARCGIPFHADCGGVNEAGNPACGTCGPAYDPGDL